MNLYSHYILAHRLKDLTQPENLAEYAWGAVIPDIRYLAGMRRQQTHVEIARVTGWLEQYPQQRSFVLGYLVHCLLDQIDVAWAVQTAFPMRLIGRVTRKKLTRQQASMLVELYYQRGAPGGEGVSGSHNPILENLGVTEQQTAAYGRVVEEYLRTPTFAGTVSLAQQLGLVADNRVEKYLKAAQSVQKAGPVLLPMLWSVHNARFERRGARLLNATLKTL
jgi:hypothetical protein